MTSLSRSDRKWLELKARNLNLPLSVVESTFRTARQHTGANLPAQKPCDIGLFSDAAAQTDLLDFISKQRG